MNIFYKGPCFREKNIILFSPLSFFKLYTFYPVEGMLFESYIAKIGS